MARFGKALKAGLHAAMAGPDGQEYQAAGRRVRCPHCENTTFVAREALLNTTGMTLLNLDWADRSGTALVCTQCALIQWFAHTPERL